MSHNLPQTSSSTNYRVIFDDAVEAYKKKTGNDLPSDPLLRRLKSCNSPDAVLVVLQEQIPAFDQSGSRLTTWVRPTVNVLCTLSSTISGAVSLAYPPAGVIVTGIAGLLAAIQGVGASQDALLDIFERIENVFRRLETYTELRPTKEMTDIIIKVMVEVLLILALVTKEIKQGRLKRFLKKVAGRSEIDDALRRLDKLTQEEHRMATVQDLKATQGVQDKMEVVVGDAEHIKGELRKVVVYVDGQQWDQLQNNLTTWLSPPDPFINYNTTSGARYGGTGVWFTESSEFNNWKVSASLLWVYGKPGAGKSIITSAIIEDIKNLSNAGTAYMAFFFFDFNDTRKQDARAFLSSVIVQLSRRSHSFYDILFNFYSVHEKGSQQPSIATLTKCFEDMIEASGDIPIYLILDAVDECPDTKGIPSSRRQVLDLVERLVKGCPPRLHLCITSRPEVDIRTSLERLTSTSNRICLHDQEGQKKDIVEFVHGVVYSDENMRRWRDEDKELVIKVLSERSNGMFRWVYCQLEVLRQCFPPSVRGVLAELPKSLDETYERILQQIPDSNRAYTHRLLQCLVVAAYPLSVEELAEVLAIDFSAIGMTPMLDVNLRLEDKERAVLSACSSLITIVDDWFSCRVQFSHFSVKEFLTSDRLAASTVDGLRYHHIRLEPAHTMMAQVCLSVLLQLKNDMDKRTIWRYPLSNYAAKHFVNHVEFENVIPSMSDGVDDLLDRDKPHFYTWVWLQIGDWDSKRWHDSNTDRNTSSIYHPSMYPTEPPTKPPPSKHDSKPKYPPRLPPLYYVAALGHLCLARHLILKCPQDLDVRDDQGCAPLHIAVLAGMEAVSQLLIEHSVDLGIQDINDRTPLHMAAYIGLAMTTQVLLERGEGLKARLNARDKNGWTPLHSASQRGHSGIAGLLLKFGADVDAQDNDSMTPLLLVSQSLLGGVSHLTGVVPLLLEHGASVHVRNKNGQMPLHVASHHAHSEIVAFLLQFGADVHAQDNDSMTPLLIVSQSQPPFYFVPYLTEIVQLLLDHGASVHVRNKNGQMPLHLASQHGRSEIVELLLGFGADVDAQDNSNITPLHFAVSSPLRPEFSESPVDDFESPTLSSVIKTIKVLLEHGANLQIQNDKGETPLQIALRRGEQEIIDVLSDDYVRNDPPRVAARAEMETETITAAFGAHTISSC